MEKREDHACISGGAAQGGVQEKGLLLSRPVEGWPCDAAVREAGTTGRALWGRAGLCGEEVAPNENVHRPKGPSE